MIRLQAFRLLSFSLAAKFTPKFATGNLVNPRLEHLAEITIRQHRRLHLNDAVLNQNKDILNAELRQHSDGIIALKQKGKCPGVIQRVSGRVEDEIDVVLDGKRLRKMTKHRTYGINTVYVRVGGEEIMCVLERADIHSDGFIQKVYLKEYKPGHPNKLKIPIELTHVTENPYLRAACEFEWKVEHAEVICYNLEYPRRFFIDISYCSPERPYRVGDLANTFPPGVTMSSKVSLSDKIVEIKYQSVMAKSTRDEIIKQIVESNKKKDKTATGDPAAAAAGGAAASTTAAKK